MALQDILNAIVKEADEQLAAAQSDHRRKTKEMREASERHIALTRRQISDQKDMKLRQIREKAQSHARIYKSRTLLAKKQEHMDMLYAKVMHALVSLPAKETEMFLSSCLKIVRGSGTLHASGVHAAQLKKLLPDNMTMGKEIAASGGFRFVSPTAEYDFTYEFLVNGLLRPLTDVDTAHGLFYEKP